MSPGQVHDIDRIVRAALDEDLGNAGDLTSGLTLPPDLTCSAEIICREEIVLSGMQAAARVFDLLPGKATFEPAAKNGDRIGPKGSIALVHGDAGTLLSGERVALNFLQHLSGVATLTAMYVREIQGTKARIVDTRKTIPGLRALEKEAVLHGGGINHRMGLYDAILIKDNHIDACGGIRQAIDNARSRLEQPMPVQVEVRNMAELYEALDCSVESVLLDNMETSMLLNAVDKIRIEAPQTVIEASGGVCLENLREIAETGVDRISIGLLTHSAPAVDIAMKYIRSGS